MMAPVPGRLDGGGGRQLSRVGAVSSVFDAAFIDPTMDCRAATFENPTGARGAGGIAHGGRKGAPSRLVASGERVVLADADGPGTIRHVWMTFPPAPPEVMRALWLEVFYDGAVEPSVSVPCLDFFGLPHGRAVPYHSALASAQEGRGFNAYFPMPFSGHVRLEAVNSGPRPVTLYYQVDYTLEPAMAAGSGFLHVTFRRENPTVLRRDFVIAEGLRGPGRFLGCAVGVRVIDPGDWYGEGEVKIYRDGDLKLPTVCGTGLEDYVGSAWGLGAHTAPYAGAPLVLGPDSDGGGRQPSAVDFAGFYRWHLADPVMFTSDLRVTIQQIGAKFFRPGQEAEMEAYEATNPVAGPGWVRPRNPAILAWGIAERVDDYCATAYVYCREAQPVARLDVARATADVERRPYEHADPTEILATFTQPSG
jgi:hypothetical protein